MINLDGAVITNGLAYCTNPHTGQPEYDALIVMRVAETRAEIARCLSSLPPSLLPDRVQAAIQREAEEMVFISNYNPFA